MKKTIMAVVALGSAQLLAGAASAQDQDDWYISASGGLSLLEDTEQTIANAPTPGSTARNRNSFEPGVGFAAAIGRELGRFRIEAEIGYTRNTQDSYTSLAPPTGTIPADVEQTALRGMANVYFDLSQGRVRPYVGAGVGLTRIDLVFVAPRAPFPNETPRELINDGETRFAYQLIGGLAVPISRRAALTAQYRWFDAGMIEGEDLRGEAITRDHSGHNIDVGLRFSF